VVGSHTELVLDGFQGSANSFATDLFLECQTHPVRVSHHLHSPAQVIEGVRRGLPVLVTIREPVDACLSLTSRWPYVSMKQALRSYLGYYGTLLPYAQHIVWSPFERTTRDLGSAVDEMNERFGTCFDRIDQEAVEKARQAHGPNKDLDEKRKRDQIKQEKLKSLDDGTCESYVQRAETLYSEIVCSNYDAVPSEA